MEGIEKEEREAETGYDDYFVACIPFHGLIFVIRLCPTL